MSRVSTPFVHSLLLNRLVSLPAFSVQFLSSLRLYRLQYFCMCRFEQLYLSKCSELNTCLYEIRTRLKIRTRVCMKLDTCLCEIRTRIEIRTRVFMKLDTCLCEIRTRVCMKLEHI